VWDAESGACLATLKGSDYNTDRAVSLAFSPNGEKIASGFSNKSVQVWDIESGELVNTLNGNNTGVGFVSFSPDGRRIISGCKRTLRVWDAETGKCGTILNIPENEYGPLDVTVLKDSNNKETIVVVSSISGNVNNNWFVKNDTCIIRKFTHVDEKYNLLKLASEAKINPNPEEDDLNKFIKLYKKKSDGETLTADEKNLYTILVKKELILLYLLSEKKTKLDADKKYLSPVEQRMYDSLSKKYNFQLIMNSQLLQRNTLEY
jgi:hypothetical protein